MKILNPKVLDDIEAGKAINLNLGGGAQDRPEYYTLDLVELAGVDIVADLNEPLKLLPENCVENIFSRHALEHVANFLPLMEEIHRITRDSGTIEIVVPHFSNVFGFSDPTHVRFFGLYSMYYFCPPEHQPNSRKVPAYYTDRKFLVENIQIDFYRASLFDKCIEPVLRRVVNRSISWQNLYERRLSSIFHAWQITYLLRPLK